MRSQRFFDENPVMARTISRLVDPDWSLDKVLHTDSPFVLALSVAGSGSFRRISFRSGPDLRFSYDSESGPHSQIFGGWPVLPVGELATEVVQVGLVAMMCKCLREFFCRRLFRIWQISDSFTRPRRSMRSKMFRLRKSHA
jgi:hypothetical protein